MRRRILIVGLVSLCLVVWSEVSRGADVVTYGSYAMVLCKWLYRDGMEAVGDGSDVDQSMEALSSIGVSPSHPWEADLPISDSDIAKILNAMITAAKRIRIPCTPERAVDLVAATSIELGLSGRDIYFTAYQIMGWSWSPFTPGPGGTLSGGTLPPVEEVTGDTIDDSSDEEEEDVISTSQ